MRVSVGPERLVGACLIAKPRRGAWAGVPLIALPPSPPSSGGSAIDEQIVSLSQLALHAQGSPLVLAPRAARKAAGAGACGAEEFSSQPTPPSTPDSGGSLASDDPAPPLPRVLKPRKRRKRERAASAPGPGPPNTPSALCACAVCRATLLRAPPPSHQQPPTPPVSPLQAKIGYSWDDIVPQKCKSPARFWACSLLSLYERAHGGDGGRNGCRHSFRPTTPPTQFREYLSSPCPADVSAGGTPALLIKQTGVP